MFLLSLGLLLVEPKWRTIDPARERQVGPPALSVRRPPSHQTPAPKRRFVVRLQCESPCPAPPEEIFVLLFFRNDDLISASRPNEGALRGSSRTSGAGCGGRVGSQHGLSCGRTIRCDGEVAWFWHPGADAKFATMLAHHRRRRGQDSRSPGRARISCNTIAQGRPGVFGQTCGDCRLHFFLQAGHGRGQRPAFPAPSRSRGRHLRTRLGRNAPREQERMRGEIAAGCQIS